MISKAGKFGWEEKRRKVKQTVWPSRKFLESLPTANLDPNCLSVYLSLSLYLPLSSPECREELIAQGWSPQFTLGCRTGCYQLPFTFDWLLTTIFLVRWLETNSKKDWRKNVEGFLKIKTPQNSEWTVACVILFMWGWTSSLDVAKFKL